MPQTRDTALEEPAANSGAPPVTETRVDAAHSIGGAVSAPLLADLSLAEMPLADLAEMPLADMAVEQAISELVRVEGVVQLRAQADQLAAHLRERQRQLEHRESQVNARVAAFEQEVRDARGWLAQRNDELNEREARLEAREAAIDAPDTGRGLASDAAELTKPKAGPVSEAGPVSRAGAGSIDGLVPSEGPLSEAAWEERKQAVARVSEQVDLRRQALEKLHDEISQMHREALELHLISRELQAQLGSSLGVEAAEEAVREARERMARRSKKEAARLRRRREELEWLRSDLAREHAKLERRYQELKGWIEHQRTCQVAGETAGDPRRSRPVA